MVLGLPGRSKMRAIKIHWVNLLVIISIIFVLELVVGFLFIPHQKKPDGEECFYPEAIAREIPARAIVAEVAEPNKIFEGIKSPKLTKKIDPLYPEEAQKAGVEGSVLLRVRTDRHGRVKRIRVLESVPLLNQAAIDAVYQWVYEPLLVYDKPQSAVFKVSARFKLTDEKPVIVTENRYEGVILGTIVEGVIDEGIQLTPVRVKGGIKPPRLIKKIEPEYPKEARETGTEGNVVLEAHTDIYGRVKRINVLRSLDPLLDEAASKAVFQWKYEPMIVEGIPREAIFVLSVSFKLK